MLRNSNSSRSFQSRTSKKNRVITSNISVILKPERSFCDDLFKRYGLQRQTNISMLVLINEHQDTMLILGFLDSPDPKTGQPGRTKIEGSIRKQMALSDTVNR